MKLLFSSSSTIFHIHETCCRPRFSYSSPESYGARRSVRKSIILQYATSSVYTYVKCSPERHDAIPDRVHVVGSCCRASKHSRSPDARILGSEQ